MVSDSIKLYEMAQNGLFNLKAFQLLVRICLTDMASDMFTYMSMLEHYDRKTEAVLIKGYRTDIFEARDDFGRNKMLLSEVCTLLRETHLKLQVHVAMLRTIDGREWEAGIFQSVVNDMPNFWHYVKDIPNNLNQVEQ